ncbi:MAG: phage major capsid protein [Sphingomonas sp.]|nr:phage major capsid protein [Sphingomonas sp.]
MKKLVIMAVASASRLLSIMPAVRPAARLTLTPPMLDIDAVLANRPRAVAGTVRADATNPVELVSQINAAFEEFKKTTEAKLGAKVEDSLLNAKLETINAEITKLSKAYDQQSAALAAARLGGGNQEARSPEAVEHADAFKAWFRRGNEPDAGMRALEVKAALTTQSDPDGGYVVPEQMDMTISRVTSTMSAMRNVANVVPVGSSTYAKLVSLGGSTSGWVGEEEARPATSTPTLSRLEFPTFELYANPAATQQMLDDAYFNVENWLADEVSIEFAEKEGAAFISGDGVKRPRGFTNYPKVANSSYAWGKVGYVATGAAGDFAAAAPGDALLALYYALRMGYRANGVFVMSDAIMLKVRQMKDGQGNYLWAPPTAAGEVPTVLGKTVYTDENMDGVSPNAYPIAFGDFKRGYIITDRMGTRILRDPYTNKPFVNFYTTKRVGGGITNFEAIKLLKLAAS